jgi:hypothetical protein
MNINWNKLPEDRIQWGAYLEILVYINPLPHPSTQKESYKSRLVFGLTWSQFYMIHDPCIIIMYTIMVPTNAHKYIEIIL